MLKEKNQPSFKSLVDKQKSFLRIILQNYHGMNLIINFQENGKRIRIEVVTYKKIYNTYDSMLYSKSEFDVKKETVSALLTALKHRDADSIFDVSDVEFNLMSTLSDTFANIQMLDGDKIRYLDVDLLRFEAKINEPTKYHIAGRHVLLNIDHFLSEVLLMKRYSTITPLMQAKLNQDRTSR